MKTKFLIGTSILILACNIFAKEVSVPFIKIISPYEGLTIRYSLSGDNPQMLVCLFDNFDNGYLKYTEDNVDKHSLPFGMNDDAQQVYFTSKGQTWEQPQGSDNLEQFHVDAKGHIVVKMKYSNSPTAYATCFYTPENSN